MWELRQRGLKVPPQAPPKTLSFREFVEKVAPHYRWYKHCEVLAGVLQRVADGKLKRVMIFMPPRHGKSELASRLFPAYWLHRYPRQWVGLASYGAELAYNLSRNARENFQRGDGQIKGDAAAVKHWETEQGGGMWAAGVGGPILGKGWNLGVIDDPIKNATEAASDTLRETQREWYDSTWYTREEPNNDGDPDGALVVINQRWRDDDLSGWLLEAETSEDDPEDAEHWHVVCFEAIKEETPYPVPGTCTLEPDWRQPGEALCPERRPLRKLERIAKRIKEYFWSALFQQRPRPREGGMFQVGWFQVVGASPAKMTRVRYWDKAGAKPGKGDWTVGVLMGRCDDGLFWIEDVVRGQWPADERNKLILATAESDRQQHGNVKQWVEQVPGLGKEATDAVIRMLAGFNAEGHPARGKKEERAEPFSAQCRAGNVRMIRAKWNIPFLAVLCAFPHGNHDDDVDASSGAFNKLAESRKLKVY